MAGRVASVAPVVPALFPIPRRLRATPEPPGAMGDRVAMEDPEETPEMPSSPLPAGWAAPVRQAPGLIQPAGPAASVGWVGPAAWGGPPVMADLPRAEASTTSR